MTVINRVCLVLSCQSEISIKIENISCFRLYKSRTDLNIELQLTKRVESNYFYYHELICLSLKMYKSLIKNSYSPTQVLFGSSRNGPPLGEKRCVTAVQETMNLLHLLQYLICVSSESPAFNRDPPVCFEKSPDFQFVQVGRLGTSYSRGNKYQLSARRDCC